MKIESTQSSLIDYDTEGVPSVSNPDVTYYPRREGKRWICDGSKGPCAHFRIHKTPCRHIIEKVKEIYKQKYISIQQLYEHLAEKVKKKRNIRDAVCDDFEEVMNYVSHYKRNDMNKLATLMLNIAVYQDSVTTDDLHVATNEGYADNPIVGVVAGALLRGKLTKVIGRKPTERRCAHGRPICIFEITKAGYEVLLQERREHG